MASSRQELEDLHSLLTRSLSERITADLDDKIPTDAATLSAAIKFLKDNAVTADPADQEDLHELQAKLAQQARRERATKPLALAKSDIENMTGTDG